MITVVYFSVAVSDYRAFSNFNVRLKDESEADSLSQDRGIQNFKQMVFQRSNHDQDHFTNEQLNNLMMYEVKYQPLESDEDLNVDIFKGDGMNIDYQKLRNYLHIV